MRAVQPLPPRQVERELLEVRPLPSRQGERQVRGGDRVIVVLYISPNIFIYFLKHPEDPDFRVFR